MANSSSDIFDPIDSREILLQEGTPKDVRLFPPPKSEDGGRQIHIKSFATKSRSIPIQTAKEREIDLQYDQDKALAEYRDYVMYERIRSSKRGSSFSRYPVVASDNSLQGMILCNNMNSETTLRSNGQIVDVSLVHGESHHATEDPHHDAIFELEL